MNTLHDFSMTRPYVTEQGPPKAKHPLTPFAAEPFAACTVDLLVSRQIGATEGGVTAFCACVGVEVRAGIVPLPRVDARHVLHEMTP